MRNSSRRFLALATLVLLLGAANRAVAQQDVQGFAVERFQASPPGSSWLTASDLDLPGGLHGGASLTLGYARNPLRVDVPGGGRLAVVSDQAFAEVAIAVGFGRLRLAAFLPSPLDVTGHSGAVGQFRYTAPHVNVSHSPDTISDVRLAAEMLVAGGANGPFRAGARAELVFPSSYRRSYLTDGSFRGIGKALIAGNLGAFRYAAHLGLHVRPLEEAAPETPRGSELLLGAAAGIALRCGRSSTLLLGPELNGASAFRSFLESRGTSLETLLGATLDHPLPDRLLLQVKLGAGAGLVTHLGAPEWRIVTGVALSRAPR